MREMILWSPLLFIVLISCPAIVAQGTVPSQNVEGAAVSRSETQQKNVQEYVELLRSDVRQQKSQIMGAMMGLDADQAAKFWPLYSEYDRELTRLNNLRVANLQDYARHYSDMTDAKTDELMQRALDFRKQRIELLAKYYVRVRESLGAIEAARFVQIENQLLEIIDLQIESSLPIASQSSISKEK